MDISHDTVKYIVILLAFIIIGYTIYLLYKDAMNTRSELVKTKSEISELKEIISSLNENDPCDGDNEEDDYDHEHDDDDDDDDYDDEDQNEGTPDLSRRWNNNNILDQLILGSEQLQNLQQLQSEIEGSKVSQIKEIENVDDNDDDNDNDNDNDDANDIEFISSSENTKCESVLKSGKNKGEKCKRTTVNNSEFCKIHKIDN